MGVGVLQAFLELFRGNFGESAGDESWRDAIGEILQGLAQVKQFFGGDRLRSFGRRCRWWLLRCFPGFRFVFGLCERLWFGLGLLQGIAESPEEFGVDAGGCGLLLGERQESLRLVGGFLGTCRGSGGGDGSGNGGADDEPEGCSCEPAAGQN